MTVYTGGCHCGDIAFRAEFEDDITSAIECNCSHCSMKGFKLAFTSKDSFTLTKGEDAFTTYHFNKGAVDHNFCKTCGVQPFGFGKMPNGMEVAAVNLNCVDALDFSMIDIEEVDGASL